MNIAGKMRIHVWSEQLWDDDNKQTCEHYFKSISGNKRGVALFQERIWTCMHVRLIIVSVNIRVISDKCDTVKLFSA